MNPRTHRALLRCWRRPIVLFTTAALVAILPVVVAPAAQADGSSCTSANPPSLLQNSYLLPPWSDSSGWKSPDQYETIVSGDVDGDGVGELVGRNAATVETWTWDRNYGTTGLDGTSNKAYDPAPGQWTQVLPEAPPPKFPSEDGWWDASRYSTFRLADVDGAKGDELIVRMPSGLSIYKWDTAKKTWAVWITTAVFSDSDGFGQSHPDTYRTITTGNIDGRPGMEILGRGPDGIQAWTLNNEDDGLTRMDFPPTPFSDANSWNHESNYSTIRVANVYGDSRDEVLGRGTDGMEVWSLDPATTTWKQVGPSLPDWGDGSGWSSPELYKTISVGDVDGDGLADVVGRTSDGVDARALVPGSDGKPTWRQLAPPGAFTDGAGFGVPAAYETFQLADVVVDPGEPHPKSEIIARNLNGLYHASLENGEWILDEVGIAQFSDTNGWGSFTPPAPSDRPVPADFRYSTIRPVTVEAGQPQLIIGRDATGIRTLAVNDLAHNSVSAPFPDYTNLTGIPVTLNPPPAQLPATAEGRSYWYINAVAHGQYFQDTGNRTTILQQYGDTDQYSNVVAFHGALGGSVFDPGKDQALNVPRATYDKVTQDVSDWTSAVSTIHDYLLGVGGQGMKQMIEQSFVTNADQVNSIKEHFEQNPALVALLGDLLWGFIGLLGALAVFIPGLSPAAVAVIAGVAGLIGSGVAAGVGFWNPNGAVDTEADKLTDEMVNAFCGAEAFVDQSYGQIVQDYGLLTSHARMIGAAPALAPLFDKSVAAMNKAKELWIWQQFGNQTFKAGWCDFGHWKTCRWSNGDPFTWNPPENPLISYRLIVGHCTDSPLALDAYAKFQELNPSVAAMMAPRQTNVPYDGSDSHTGPGTPPSGLNDGFMGTQGWNLGVEECYS